MSPLERLRGSLRDAPIIWKGDYPYFIHSITDGVPRLDPQVLQSVIDISIKLIDWEQIDVIVGIEAMGLPLCAPLSLAVDKPLAIIRKRSYGLEDEIRIDQSTGYSKGEMFINDISASERVFILEDVISTGGTMDAVLKGLNKSGAIPKSVLTVVEKGDGMTLLKEKYQDVQFQSMVRLRMNDGTIELLE